MEYKENTTCRRAFAGCSGVMKITLLTAIALPLIIGCAAIGLTSTQALVAAGAVTTAAVVAEGREESSIEVRGNYDGDSPGYWFDRSLYHIWVTSDSAEDSERVARAAATDACTQRGGLLKAGDTGAWREWPPFTSITRKRFSFEMKFRCELDT